MPINLPNPNDVGGSWGAGMYPSWYQQGVDQYQMDPTTAANNFLQFILAEHAQNPAKDYGWYWNSFLPGAQNAGQNFGNTNGNLPPRDGAPPVKDGPPVLPGNPSQPKPGQTQPGGGSGNPNGGNPNVPPRPTTPGGPEPNYRWVIRTTINPDGSRGYIWKWEPFGGQQPIAKPPVQPPTTPPMDTTKPPGTVQPPVTPPPPPGPGPGGWLQGQSSMAHQQNNLFDSSGPGNPPRPPRPPNGFAQMNPTNRVAGAFGARSQNSIPRYNG